MVVAVGAILAFGVVASWWSRKRRSGAILARLPMSRRQKSWALLAGVEALGAGYLAVANGFPTDALSWMTAAVATTLIVTTMAEALVPVSIAEGGVLEFVRLTTWDRVRAVRWTKAGSLEVLCREVHHGWDSLLRL